MRLDDPELQAIADEAMADIHAGRIGPREIDVWWERRRTGELTTEYLGRVLDEAGLPELAADARAGHYDDYFCPPDVADGLETLRLVRDLRRARDVAMSTTRFDQAGRIKVIDEAVRNGEFDGTKEESDRWAASESGQAAFRELTKDAVVKAAKRDGVGRNDRCPCGSGRKFKHCHGRPT